MTTVVLGLDGASFELLDGWINSGELPNIKKICTDGAAMDMQSCLPPVTCPNWRCYATGVNPGKLGVFWWEHIDRAEHTISNASSSNQFDGREYWKELEGDTSVINFPTGYPPSDISGEFIAGGPGSEQTGYTNPETVESDLRTAFDYQVHPEQLSLLEKTDQENGCIDEIYRLIDQRFDVLEERLAAGEYELIHMTVFYINVLQHFYWNKDIVREAWKRIDNRIRSLLEMDELDRLFVMSDHGSNQIETQFHINTWLEQNGYLVRATSASDFMHRAGITRDRVRPVLNQLGLEWWARRVLPSKFKDLLPDADGKIKKSGKEDMIDWEASTAVASGQGPVYVLADDKAEQASIKDQLIDDLDGLRAPDGTQVVNAARPAESVWKGPYVDDGPDLVIEQAPNIYIDGSIGANESFGNPKKWSGENKDTGLFIAYGNDLDANASVTDMHITDIAPTLLHLHGVPVPNEMDGTPRTELFESESNAAKREINYEDRGWITARKRERKRPEEAVQDRLGDLGYLSE